MPLILYIFLAFSSVSCHSIKSKQNLNSKKCYIEISEIAPQGKTIIDTSQEYLHFKGNISVILSKILNINVNYSVRPLDFIQSDIEIICKKYCSKDELVKKIESYIYSKFNLKLERKTVLVDSFKFTILDSNLLNKNGNVVYNHDDIKSWPSREIKNKLNTSNDYPVWLAPIDFLLYSIVYIYDYNLQYIQDTITIKNKKYIYNNTKNLTPCKMIDNEVFEYYCTFNIYDFLHLDTIKGQSFDSVGPFYSCGIPYYIAGDLKELKSFMRNKLGISTESKLTKTIQYRLKYSYK